METENFIGKVLSITKQVIVVADEGDFLLCTGNVRIKKEVLPTIDQIEPMKETVILKHRTELISKFRELLPYMLNKPIILSNFKAIDNSKVYDDLKKAYPATKAAFERAITPNENRTYRGYILADAKGMPAYSNDYLMIKEAELVKEVYQFTDKRFNIATIEWFVFKGIAYTYTNANKVELSKLITLLN